MWIEVWLWLTGAGILLVGGVLRLWPYRGEPVYRPRLFGLIVPMVAVCLGLICVVAGLVWRASKSGTWPGSTQADAMAMLASGTLVALFWNTSPSYPAWALVASCSSVARREECARAGLVLV